ncbi:type III-B CRISPR module-associated protein Cmr5 [Peptococcaceae bacterium]|nr:type III-B CRISPR module-associated protein Cmr5 [Peptococcaceae bacterium]
MGSSASKIKELEQGRAEFAYICASKVVNFGLDDSLKSDKILKKMFLKKYKNTEKEIFERFFENPNMQSEDDREKELIENLKSFHKKLQKEYKSYVKKIPMLIRTNGLGATFAFMFSKGEVYELIGEQILEWLKRNEKQILSGIEKINSFSDLVKYSVSLNSPEYRALTIEVLAFLNWLKRFAEGLIEGEEKQ